MDWGSKLLSVLLAVSVRALIVAAAAWCLLRFRRLRTASASHAVWTLAAMGMLLSLALEPLLPSVPVRVLHDAPQTVAGLHAAAPVTSDAPAIPLQTNPPFRWQQPVAVVYCLGVAIFLLRMALAYAVTWRLLRESAKLEHFAAGDVYESGWIAVPMTTGWLRPKILLPCAWRDWEPAKLEAVFAHERAHVHRADWAIGVVAAINRSVFWFHPLSWWLEHTLARLAEHACDDAALREANCREEYAQVLLEMAEEVKERRSRMVWEAMAMAKDSEVRVRIDRILDEARPLAPGWNRARWAGLLACGVPLICAVSVVRLAPAAPLQQAPPAPAAPHSAPAAAPVRTAAKSAAPAKLEPLRTVAPNYPAAARAANVAGTVRLSIQVGRDGTVTDVTSATGHPLLIPAAAEAVRQWVYPPQRNGSQLQVSVPVLPLAAAAQVPVSAAVPPAAVTALEPVTRVEPVYPRIAEQTGAKGTVELQATIGRDGRVTAVKVLRGHPMLQSAAMEAVKQWVYGPQESEVSTVVKVNFAGTRPALPAGEIRPATLLKRMDPIYPPAAKQANITGAVSLEITIGTDGLVKAVNVLDGDPLLAQAAEDAVRQWVYRPTLLNGVPVETNSRVVLRFRGSDPPAQ